MPAKTKLNTIDVLISKALIDSNISNDEFVFVNNVVKEDDDTKEGIENSNNKQNFGVYMKRCSLIVWSVEKINKIK